MQSVLRLAGADPSMIEDLDPRLEDPLGMHVTTITQMQDEDTSSCV